MLGVGVVVRLSVIEDAACQVNNRLSCLDHQSIRHALA